MASIYELSWNKDSFMAKLCLFFESNQKERKRIKLDDNIIKTRGYSALSSTYYSISGTAQSQFKAMFKSWWFLPIKLPIFILTWAPLGFWCYHRMLYLSDCAVKFSDEYENMTAGMCDIRQSILRRRGKYNEAEALIKLSLEKKDIEKHTIALLYIGLADIYKSSGDWRRTEKYVGKALEIATQVEETSPFQAVRIYKHSANLTDWFEQGDPLPGNDLRKKAEYLARRIDAKDQILKIKN